MLPRQLDCSAVLHLSTAVYFNWRAPSMRCSHRVLVEYSRSLYMARIPRAIYILFSLARAFFHTPAPRRWHVLMKVIITYPRLLSVAAVSIWAFLSLFLPCSFTYPALSSFCFISSSNLRWPSERERSNCAPRFVPGVTAAQRRKETFCSARPYFIFVASPRKRATSLSGGDQRTLALFSLARASVIMFNSRLSPGNIVTSPRVHQKHPSPPPRVAALPVLHPLATNPCY